MDPTFELLPIADGTFIRRDQNVKYTFVKSAIGINALHLSPARGPAMTAPKLSAEALIPYEQLLASNISKAMEAHREIESASDNVTVSEERLNSLGYEFLRAKNCPRHLRISN